MKKNPIVISGPSGSGKSALIDNIEKKDSTFKEAVGVTTRERRPMEIAKMDFISKEEFQKLIEENNLIEYSIYNNNYYGVSKSEFEKMEYFNLIFNVSYSSAHVIQSIYPDTNMVYLLPPNKEELLRRLGDRDYERYLVGIKETMEYALLYDYLLISQTNDLDKTTDDFMDIISQNDRGKQKKLTIAKNKDFIRNFYN